MPDFWFSNGHNLKTKTKTGLWSQKHPGWGPGPFTHSQCDLGPMLQVGTYIRGLKAGPQPTVPVRGGGVSKRWGPSGDLQDEPLKWRWKLAPASFSSTSQPRVGWLCSAPHVLP